MSVGSGIARWIGAAMLATAFLPGMAHAKRLALVVGNADYDTVADLKNPVRDASAIADELKRLGFEVTLLTDVGTDAFWQKLEDFGTRAETAESTVFYYSGHAFQMNGVNYLVPVAAELKDRTTLATETWGLDRIIARLQSRNRQTLVFLDACRNDPLPVQVRGSSGAGGLARVQTGVGTFVAFATEPGGVAADAVGDAPHSPFTGALLAHMGTKGVSISDMMIEVRNEVEVVTARKQVPWDQSSLRSQFYFVAPSEDGKQELSDADYELLAQLQPDDRRKFLDLLKQSGFDEQSLASAEAAIAVAESNLEIVASQASVIGGPAETAALPTPAGAEADLMAGLVVVESDVTIGAAPVAPTVDVAVPQAPGPTGNVPTSTPILPQTTDTVLAGLSPALAPAGSTPANADPAEALPHADAVPQGLAPIRLAALDYRTREISLDGIAGGPVRVTGRLIEPDSDENRALLAAIDPALIETARAMTALSPKDIAMGVQGELKRLGCYRMTVDGSWGKGSRTALTSYFLAKRVVPDSLEPTQALFDRLRGDTQIVCANRVASSSVKTGKSPKATVDATKAATKGEVIPGRAKNSRKPQETMKKKIEKSSIGMTGSF